MSLINEALKKAQRARVEEQAGSDVPATPGGPVRIAKRSRAKSANTMVLLGAGALVLVVLSVVVTVYLVNRPNPPTSTVATAAPTPPQVDAPNTSAAPIPPSAAKPPTAVPETTPAASSVPVAASANPSPLAEAKTPPSSAAPNSSPTPPAAATPLPALANAPAVAPSAPTPAVPTPTPKLESTSAAPASPATGSANAKPDERVAAFVDAIRVTATRAAEGRVLMNDRVYRINDIVERTLGVRLTKVAIDSLTFTDANGVTYVKYF